MKERIKYLVEKQNELRQEFEMFLLMWEKQTKEIKDEGVSRIQVYENDIYYYLKTGEKNIFSRQHWENKFFDTEEEIETTEITISIIKKITENLQYLLQDWIKVERCSQEYQNCIEFLKKIKEVK